MVCFAIVLVFFLYYSPLHISILTDFRNQYYSKLIPIFLNKIQAQDGLFRHLELIFHIEFLEKAYLTIFF
jgi:hypothetical protein